MLVSGASSGETWTRRRETCPSIRARHRTRTRRRARRFPRAPRGTAFDDIRRHVRREHDEAIRAVVRRGAVGHRTALREAGEDEGPPRRMVSPDLGEGAADVVDVVADGEFAIVTRHPVRDDALLPRIERVQRLDGDKQPLLRSWNRHERVEVIAGCFRIAVKADQQRPWRGHGRHADKISTVCSGLESVDCNQGS